MSELRDCLQCNNYRFYLEIQLVDDKGYPLNDIPLLLLERGTEKQHQGITDPFGLLKIEGLSNRPLQLTIDAQKLADKLTTEPLGSVIHTNYASIEQYCSTEKYVLSSNHIAGDFNQQLPDIVHEMSQGQIQRLSHYRNCQKSYSIFPPYNQRIVISIQSIAEPVFAKSELRGLGNTHAGTQNEPVCHFGRCNLNGLKEGEYAQAIMFPFPAPSLFPGGSGIMAGAGINAVHQSIEQDFDNISTRPIFPKFKDRESLVSTPFVMAGGLFWASTGVFIRQLFNDDTLSYDDLLEKAENNELVPTRIRIAVNDQDIAIPYHTAKGSGKEYVPIIKGELAYEYEANEVRSLGGYQSNDGLPSEITQANIYRFITQYGITYFLGVTASGKIINLSVKADDQEIRLVNPGFPIQDPDELPPPHTGTPAQDLSEFNSNSAGGYQIYDEEPTITVTPAPPDIDFRDFIFITPVADVPAIYVYLSEELEGMSRPMRDVNVDYPPSQIIIDKMKEPKFQNWANDTHSTDCSDIAASLLNVGEENGYILEARPRLRGNLNVYESGIIERNMEFHQVYTDGKYVYDPRVTINPIPKGDWEQHIKGINPDGVIISDKYKGLK